MLMICTWTGDHDRIFRRSTPKFIHTALFIYLSMQIIIIFIHVTFLEYIIYISSEGPRKFIVLLLSMYIFFRIFIS